VIARSLFAASIVLSLSLSASLPFVEPSVALAAGVQVTGVELKQAQEYLRDKDWERAVKAFASIVQREPKNGPAWFGLGRAQHGAANYASAIDAFQHAVDIGHNPIAMYDLACSYALANDKEKAFEWLDRAVQSGFDQSQQLQSDADLESLRADPRFKALVARAQALERPCAQALESRQFDFWIGEWDVQDTAGRVVGKSSIQLILGDCVIYENWTSGNHSGKSFKAFDKDEGKWIQTWVDDQGDVTKFVNGEFKEHALHFDAKKKGADGKPIDKHLTFFDLGDGRVRQFAELSSDGGKTWKTEYDLLYVRRA
jgi:tetratricopeptide (TPR) repeat protein